MADNLTFVTAMALGLGPALFVLWFSLHRFDYPRAEHALFDDRRIFFALAVGMAWGVIASVLTTFVAAAGIAGDLFSAYVIVLGIVMLEESFKMAYLGRKGYRTRFDTTFTGVALGLGSAATLVAASGFLDLAGSVRSAADLLPLAVFSVTMSAMHAVSGGLIGFGSAQGAMGTYYGRAILARSVNMLLMVPFFLPTAFANDPAIAYVSLAAGLVEALLLYRYLYLDVLPETLPKDVRRELRRWRARSVRQ